MHLRAASTWAISSALFAFLALPGCGGKISDNPAYGLVKPDGGLDGDVGPTDTSPPPPDGGCSAPLTLCGDRCVDLRSDTIHCGACFVGCADGVCRGGVCGPPDPCPAPLVRCGFGGCIDLTSDPTNCGSCGNRCAAGSSCTGGKCADTSGDGTTGKPCKDDGECDLSGTGESACSSSIFSGGTYSPTATCMRTSCTPSVDVEPTRCDRGVGVCLPVDDTGTVGYCFGSCSFDDSGAPVKGCAGKNACFVYTWQPTSPVATGTGYCFGGCKVDSDCSGGDKCDTVDGYCKRSPAPRTKKIGQSCTYEDYRSGACNCAVRAEADVGYCSKFCKVGEEGFCTPGYQCDSLPAIDYTTGGEIPVRAVPSGISGYCLKTCVADVDCKGLGETTCRQTSGLKFKTCQPIGF